MANREMLDKKKKETYLIIKELLDDGSDPDGLYMIEHHFSAENFDVLEKAAIAAFNLGYEIIEDPEEFKTQDGSIVWCCDVISEMALNAELINAQVEQLMTLAEEFGVSYEDWGTYYEDPKDKDDEDENGNIALFDEDDDGKRH